MWLQWTCFFLVLSFWINFPAYPANPGCRALIQDDGGSFQVQVCISRRWNILEHHAQMDCMQYSLWCRSLSMNDERFKLKMNTFIVHFLASNNRISDKKSWLRKSQRVRFAPQMQTFQRCELIGTYFYLDANSMKGVGLSFLLNSNFSGKQALVCYCDPNTFDTFWNDQNEQKVNVNENVFTFLKVNEKWTTFTFLPSERERERFSFLGERAIPWYSGCQRSTEKAEGAWYITPQDRKMDKS